MSENNMTKSQAKRKARQEANQKAKREAKRATFTSNLLIILVIAIFAAGIGSFVYYRMTTTQSSSDYSAFLNEDGTLKNVNPTDYITPLDYKNIVVPQSELEYTEEDMTAELDSLLSSNSCRCLLSLSLQESDSPAMAIMKDVMNTLGLSGHG